MRWTPEDLRRVVGMLGLGMSVRAALLETGLTVGDLVRNLWRMSRPRIIEHEVHAVGKPVVRVEERETAKRGFWRLFDMKDHQCRWSDTQSGEFLFCGEPKSEGVGPWCKDHRSIVYRKVRRA